MATESPGRIIHPLGIAICLALAGDLTLFALLPLFRAEVGLTLGAVGVMFGVNRLVRVIGNPVAGHLIQRIGKRRFLLIGYTLAVICTFGYAGAHGFWAYMSLRIAWGFAWVLIYLGSMTYIFDVTTLENRGKFSGVFMTWFMVGLAGGSFFGGSMADSYGYATTMFACGCLAVVSWLVIAFLIPKDPNAAQIIDKMAIKAMFGSLLDGYYRLLSSQPEIKTVLLFYWVTQFANDGIALGTISLLYLERFPDGFTIGGVNLGLATISGFSIAFRYIISSVFSPLFGSLSDGKTGRAPVILLSLILGIVGFVILANAETMDWIIISLTINALSVGAALSSLAGLLGDLTTKENEGQALGLYATAGDLGGAVGSFFCYSLLPFIGLNWIYLLSSACFLIVLLSGINLFRKPIAINTNYKPL
ncbi:MAG: MFS transporter [Anaerolineales bacterium]|nr:MFS transporter [Anaerolineales bacterium]